MYNQPTFLTGNFNIIKTATGNSRKGNNFFNLYDANISYEVNHQPYDTTPKVVYTNYAIKHNINIPDSGISSGTTA